MLVRVLSLVGATMAAATVAAGMTVTVPAHAAAGPAVAGGIRYVALGDSFAAGEGVEPYLDQRIRRFFPIEYVPTPGFVCHRSQRGWPRQVVWPGSSRPLAEIGRFDLAACSGARIGHAGAVEQTKVYAGTTTRLSLQLSRLGTDDDLVTVSLGGNDVGFSEILAHCAVHESCQQDPFVTVGQGTPHRREVTLDEWARIRIGLVQNEIGGLYRAIRARVGPATRVLVTTYPRLLSVHPSALFGLCTERLLYPEGERQWLADRVDEFDAVIARQAAGTGLLLADVRPAFTNHAVCDRDPWIAGLTAARRTDLTRGLSPASFHPNAKGAAAYAAVVNATLARPSTAPAAPADESTVDLLAGYPRDLVEAVAATTLVPVSLENTGAGLVSFSATGFAPGGPVEVSLDGDAAIIGGAAIGAGVVRFTADAGGRVVGQVRLAPDGPAERVVGIRVEGGNPGGAAAVGVATINGGAPRAAHRGL